jgi:hypothetical protein
MGSSLHGDPPIRSNVTAQWLSFCLEPAASRLQFSVRRPVVFTDIYRGFLSLSRQVFYSTLKQVTTASFHILSISSSTLVQ